MLIKIKVFFHMLKWNFVNRNKWVRNPGVKEKARARERSRYFNIAKNQAVMKK